MARHVVPEQDHANLDFGRFLQDTAYARDRKEISVGHLKFDLIRRKDGQLVIGEVKKIFKVRKECNDATCSLSLRTARIRYRSPGRTNVSGGKETAEYCFDSSISSKD